MTRIFLLCYNSLVEKADTYIILYNAGGGMRGLIPAHIMSRIEEETGQPISDMVDIFCGPSTGAILNAALTLRDPTDASKPKYKAKQMVRFYEREGIRIFPPDRYRAFRGLLHDFNNRTMRLNQLKWLFKHGHYDSKHLKRALRMLYGHAQLQSARTGLVIPVYNIDGGHISVIEEYDETGNTPVRTKNNFNDSGGHAVWLKHMETGFGRPTNMEVKLVDSVLASCAAPSFFPCHHFPVRYASEGKTRYYSGIDGSIFDNPCISYHGAIKNHIPPGSNIIMIVIGTGYTNKSVSREEWNQMGALGVVDPANDLPLINIFFHASETALIDAFQEEIGEHLYIFNKNLVATERNENFPSEEIDDASPENLQRLKNFADLIIDENKQSFDTLCELLKSNTKNRQKRSKKMPAISATKSKKKGGLFSGFLGGE